MRYRGRRWNNILMLSVIAFIGVLNLPTLIKAYLIEPEPQVDSPYPYLLNPAAELQALHFASGSIIQQDNQWVYQFKGADSSQVASTPVSNTPVPSTQVVNTQVTSTQGTSVQDTSAKKLSQRWKELVGTEVDAQTYTDLTPRLNTPHTIEVWYQDQEEPQRITYYRLPEFWLLKNWNDQWLAVSIEESYLFPSFNANHSSKSDD
ncbi:hypothetical protein [uncultured Vibrio sp.]|uniref:hypothetical protein n=1 Tax=uncultured Vibrio sp. TaxID=114054 RepID=UPI0026058575|nr:hypothetical protein [uncultured Vibrio sp.]